jgi:hypothetical protein
MVQPSLEPTGAPSEVSERVQIARLALAAAINTRGVISAAAGEPPLWVTADPSGLLHGVTATATADGRFDVALRLVAELVPLHALADRVCAAVRDAVGRAGFGEHLASVRVEIADVRGPEEAGGPS